MSILDSIAIERGETRDYDALARFHYRAGRPATIARIDRAVLLRPSVIDRLLDRASAGETIGVLVMSMPVLGCAARNAALAGRYSDLPRAMSARLLNREMRTISRVIIDPRCRGLGLAAALVRVALDAAETTYTEALASMGRVNPFFEKAGMQRYEPPPSPAAERLSAVLEALGIPVAMLASRSAFERARCGLDPQQRAWLRRELLRFARPMRSAAAQPDEEAAIDIARRRLAMQPIYYLAMQRSEIRSQRRSNWIRAMPQAAASLATCDSD